MTIDKKKTRIIAVMALLLYIIAIFWFTVFKRSIGIYSAQFDLFWSYKRWLSGDWLFGKEILLNIVMFMPLGFLLSACTGKGKWQLPVIVVSAALISGLIETLQLQLMRGLFEYDDIISNTVGAIAGWIVFHIVQDVMPSKHVNFVIVTISAVFVIGCCVVYLSGGSEVEADTTSLTFCFQVDDAELNGNRLMLSGFVVDYEQEPEKPIIILKSESSEIEFVLDGGLVRNDVNNYFRCNYDYTDSGFKAAGEINLTEEYQVFLNLGWPLNIPTGVYITGSDIHYAPTTQFREPEAVGTEIDEIIENGYLRAYRPDYQCWVYQYEGALYWIVDEDFYFEDDGSTYIQYQLYTTQPEKLPAVRQENGWDWDNIGGYFEEYELEGNFGQYRVMKRELPTEYSITSILTGYHKDGKWVWREYFRPIYEFD